jgi:hypothetical protein
VQDFGMNGENTHNKSTWSVNSSVLEGKNICNTAYTTRRKELGPQPKRFEESRNSSNMMNKTM